MDTISNLLISIKNAGNAGKTSVEAPYSKYKHAVCDALVRLKFIEEVHKKTAKGGFPVLVIELAKTGKRKTGVINGLRRVSKPSRRMYIGSKAIRPVRNGSGYMVLSTPKGILEGEEARKQQVGGELLFEIW
jgi:small subunit ribosomal protein S8